MSYSRTLITTKEAAEILGLAESTLRGHKAGTQKLTRIKQKTKSVRMVRQEVEAHIGTLYRKTEPCLPLNTEQVR